MQSKVDLRTEMRRERGKLETDWKLAYDHKICKHLLNLISKKDIKTVHCYLPLDSEVDTLPLISELIINKVKVICPKTLINRKLEHIILTDIHSLDYGKFGTKHPSSKQIYTDDYDFIIVPGLAFDTKNYRLGYGGGYYDSFLSANSSAYQIGIAYPFQIKEKIPVEKHDACLDEVLYFDAL